MCRYGSWCPEFSINEERNDNECKSSGCCSLYYRHRTERVDNKQKRL